MLSSRQRVEPVSASSGQYLNCAAVCSPIGAVRVCQLTLVCSALSLVLHGAGHSAPYGTFCLAVWVACFAATGAVLVLDVTRLRECVRVSWDELTVALASLSALLTLTASVLYPLYFVRADDCPYNDCEVRNFRIAVSVCSWAGCVAYGAELFLSRRGPSYMATPSGLLKVVQVFVASVTFVLLANGGGASVRGATLYCVTVFGLCCAASLLMVALAVSGRRKALPLPFERLVVLVTLVAVLLYASAAVVWPVFCFDRRYGDPLRPLGCPRGSCPWDSKLAVAVLSVLNLALYTADLACSQRRRPPQRPLL